MPVDLLQHPSENLPSLFEHSIQKLTTHEHGVYG